MKKVAVVTMNHGYNYGNKLQNYAVKKMYENLDCDVETISFQPKNNNKVINNQTFIEKIKKKVRKILYFKREKNRLIKFKKFNQKFLNMTDKIYTSDNYKEIDCNSYDLFSVGSDQVWNSYFWDFSSFYLLDFVDDSNKKISYAASFGVDDINPVYKEKFKECLNQFRCISVRELQGKKIIKDLIDKDVPVVLDPTLMVSRKDWIDFSIKPEKNQPKKYIFTYFLGEVNKERKKEIKEFARKKKLDIITLNDITSRYYDCNPNEMIYLIRNAEYILTDSFHACVFSIIFEKNFYIFDRVSGGKNMNSRIETLLTSLEIHKMGEKDLNIDCNYDYKKINSKLNNIKDESYKYLYSVLGDRNDK